MPGNLSLYNLQSPHAPHAGLPGLCATNVALFRGPLYTSPSPATGRPGMTSPSTAERVAQALQSFRAATASGSEDPLHQSLSGKAARTSEVDSSKLDRLLHRLAEPELAARPPAGMCRPGIATLDLHGADYTFLGAGHSGYRPFSLDDFRKRVR